MPESYDTLPPGFVIQPQQQPSAPSAGFDELPPGFVVQPPEPPGFLARNWDVVQRVLAGPVLDMQTQQAADVTETAARGAVRGIPFIGPSLERGIESLEQLLTGKDLADIQARGEQLQAEYPGVDFAAELVGEWVLPFTVGVPPVVGRLSRPARLSDQAINRMIGHLDDAARQAFRSGNQAAGKEIFKRARGVEALSRLRGAQSVAQAQGRIRALVSNRKQLGRFPPEVQAKLRDLANADEGDFARLAKDIADEFLTGLIPGARTAARRVANSRGVRQIDRETEALIRNLQEPTAP